MEGVVAKGSWTISDALWAQIVLVLPPARPKPEGGRPRMPDRPAMEAIFSEFGSFVGGDAGGLGAQRAPMICQFVLFDGCGPAKRVAAGGTEGLDSTAAICDHGAGLGGREWGRCQTFRAGRTPRRGELRR